MVGMALPFLAAAEPKHDVKPSIWKIGAAKDGSQSVSDGTLTVAFPAEAKVKAEGDYVSGDAEQKTGKKTKGYLSVERKPLPAEAKKAADPLKWLEASAKAEVEKEKAREPKNYRDVRLLKSEKIDFGKGGGWKSVVDSESEYASLKIEGGMHNVTEQHVVLIGDYLYSLGAGGTGAPAVPQLFGDNTGFHKSEIAQQFLKSVRSVK